MKDGFNILATRIGDFLDVTQDGYAIFSAKDILIGCNRAFADILYLDEDNIIGKSFDDLYRAIYNNQQGPKIDTQDIESWLTIAAKKRRSRGFRLFEIDLIDGRWFLISEQALANGDLLVQAKNITKQKVVEHDLHQHTSVLSNLAATDELTQISNRRSFISQVQVELKRCERNNLPAVFCLLDIDYFKKVNDNFGHLAGDKVLIKLTKLVKSELREYDPFGRIGGEEFGILLPETHIEDAKEITQRLCEVIAKAEFNDSSNPISVTVSIGLSENTQGQNFEQLYGGADLALYEAKDRGRNQIAVNALS